MKVQGLKLGQGEPNWEKQVELSRRVDSMGRDEPFDDKPVLDLPLVTPAGSTVGSALAAASEEARVRYVPTLQAEVGEANVHCWALVRVGMARIVCEEVLPHKQQ